MKQFLTLICILSICLTINGQTIQQDKDTSSLNEKELKLYQNKIRKDSIRATKKIWTSVLGGPSYTPEASLGLGGALLISFDTNATDTISQRSFIPVGFNVSLNGTFVFAGTASLFFRENKFRIYTKYSFRNEPTRFYGVGINQIEHAEDLIDYLPEDSVVMFDKTNIIFNPKFVWAVKPNVYIGAYTDFNYNKSTNINNYMQSNEHVQKYGTNYHNIGIGALIQYDSRDNVATPHTGTLLSLTAASYGKFLGGQYNYEILDLEYRQFQPMLNRRSTLAWVARTQIGFDNVPYSELPSFGSPFDLRGYLIGKYRDKSMAYGIVEYRHSFMSQEKYDQGSFLAKTGVVAWIGTGTLGDTPKHWEQWRFNYGVGLRIELQPGKNFRIDLGREPGQPWAFYMNMTEAF